MIRKSGYRFSEKICHFSTAFGGVTPATAAEKSEFSEQESASDQALLQALRIGSRTP